MVYIAKIKSKFDAAHKIAGVNKKCENLHGHTYHIEVQFKYEKLGENGVCEDFTNLKNIVREAIDSFDHTYLNDTVEQPTAENIAGLVYELIKSENSNIYKVIVWETENAGVEYYED